MARTLAEDRGITCAVVAPTVTSSAVYSTIAAAAGIATAAGIAVAVGIVPSRLLLQHYPLAARRPQRVHSCLSSMSWARSWWNGVHP